jgi:hypothetical protein
MQDVKAARQLASDITQSGAKLYDLLENEHVERQERAKALRFLDLAASTSGTTMRLLLSLVIFLLTFFLCIDGPREQAYIERSIRDIIENTKQALEDARFARHLLLVYVVLKRTQSLLLYVRSSSDEVLLNFCCDAMVTGRSAKSWRPTSATSKPRSARSRRSWSAPRSA